jgi:RND family efflux transporter MFP subunit
MKPLAQPNRRAKRARIARSLLLAALAVGVPLGAAGAQQGKPSFVQVDKVSRAPLVQTIPVVGRLVARQSGTIAARSAGPVAKLLVEVGERVKQGQELARLVTATLEAQRDLRLAELRSAQQELSRLERLRSSRSAAFPRARYETALQNVAKAEASLKLAQIELNYAVIRAPFPGVVTVKHTEIGAYVRAGDAVVTLVNDRALEIEADVPADRVAGLTQGRNVRFTLAGTEYDAIVRAVVPVDSPLTRTRAVRFIPRFSGKIEDIAVNQSVTVAVPIGASRTVVSVHKDAVIHRGEATIVYVVAGAKAVKPPMVLGKAVPRPVKLGDAVGGRFVVLGGLKPGDIVVVRGNERLRPGQMVIFRNGS